MVGTRIVGLTRRDTSIAIVTMLSSTNAMPIYTLRGMSVVPSTTVGHTHHR